MLRGAVMLEAFAVLGCYDACITTPGGTDGAMHRTGHNGHSCATQRREPWREENDRQS